MSFKITRGSGFQMTFGNGWTVSVQWAGGNYSSNYSADINTPQPTAHSAEIAAWDKNGKWHDFGDDTVKGWCTTKEVAEFISFIANKE